MTLQFLLIIATMLLFYLPTITTKVEGQKEEGTCKERVGVNGKVKEAEFKEISVLPVPFKEFKFSCGKLFLIN